LGTGGRGIRCVRGRHGDGQRCRTEEERESKGTAPVSYTTPQVQHLHDKPPQVLNHHHHHHHHPPPHLHPLPTNWGSPACCSSCGSSSCGSSSCGSSSSSRPARLAASAVQLVCDRNSSTAHWRTGPQGIARAEEGLRAAGRGGEVGKRSGMDRYRHHVAALLSNRTGLVR